MIVKCVLQTKITQIVIDQIPRFFSFNTGSNIFRVETGRESFFLVVILFVLFTCVI